MATTSTFTRGGRRFKRRLFEQLDLRLMLAGDTACSHEDDDDGDDGSDDAVTAITSAAMVSAARIA